MAQPWFCGDAVLAEAVRVGVYSVSEERVIVAHVLPGSVTADRYQ